MTYFIFFWEQQDKAELGQKKVVSGTQQRACQPTLYLAQAGDSFHDFHKL